MVKKALFIITIFFILIIEIILRVFPSDGYQRNFYERSRNIIQYNDEYVQYDSLLGYRLKPSLDITHFNTEFYTPVKTNKYGQRDDSSNSADVLFLGDSHFFGWGVEINERLDKIYTKSKQITSYNLVMSGYSTIQSILSFEQYIKHNKAPEKVFFCVFPNDIQENRSWGAYPYVRNEQEQEFGRQQEFGVVSIEDYNLWREITQDYMNGFWTKNSRILDLLKVNYRNLSNYNGKQSERVNASKPFDQENNYTKAFEYCFKYLTEKYPNIQIHLLLLPDKSSAIENIDHDHLKLARKVLDSYSCSIIDLKEVLDSDDYFELDDHINKTGHATIAQYLINEAF